jgi:hypothetical protein
MKTSHWRYLTSLILLSNANPHVSLPVTAARKTYTNEPDMPPPVYFHHTPTVTLRLQIQAWTPFQPAPWGFQLKHGLEALRWGKVLIADAKRRQPRHMCDVPFKTAFENWS